MQLKKWLLFLGILTPKQVIYHKLLLLDCKIHGSHYYACVDMVKRNKLTKNQPLILRRETNNSHDNCAIEVITTDGKKLGYIPKKDNKIVANLIDQKVYIDAFILNIDQDAWDPVEIKVTLHLRKIT